MKPTRLKLLIALFIVASIIVGVVGILYADGFGLWLPLMLVLLFTANLLMIPHNSGRHWAHFIAFGLLAYAAMGFIVFFRLSDNTESGDLSLLEGLGTPVFSFLLGLEIFFLSFHSSVCDFFDSIVIEVNTPEDTKTNMQDRSS